MVCPIISANDTGNVECVKENCAWWDNGNKCCAVLSLVVELIKTGEIK
jgi:hypothetical protein